MPSSLSLLSICKRRWEKQNLYTVLTPFLLGCLYHVHLKRKEVKEHYARIYSRTNECEERFKACLEKEELRKIEDPELRS